MSKDTDTNKFCIVCGRPKRKSAFSSITSWIFRNSICDCSGKKDSFPMILEPTKLSQEEIKQLGLPDHMEVINRIGGGGMGIVYHVNDKQLEKEFAVKILRSELVESSTNVDRFKKEAESVSTLDHPGIVTVYSYDETSSGNPYVLMDLIEGKNLSDIIEEEVYLEIDRAIDLVTQISDSMAHAHARGIIHCDLKPSNIIITKSEDTELVKIVDFGIAKITGAESIHKQIQETGEFAGSPLYLSPEQCHGSSLDHRSDIYSLGCIFFELITGKPPFVGDNAVKTIMKHVNERPENLVPQLNRFNVSKGLQKIILHCLEKEPSKRYLYMDELIKDLELTSSGSEPIIALQQDLEEGVNVDSKIGRFIWTVVSIQIIALLIFLLRLDSLTASWLFAIGLIFITVATAVLAFVGIIHYQCKTIKRSIGKGGLDQNFNVWLNRFLRILQTLLILFSLSMDAWFVDYILGYQLSLLKYLWWGIILVAILLLPAGIKTLMEMKKIGLIGKGAKAIESASALAVKVNDQES